MEELTIEQKARAYDMAVERARKLYNSEESSADVEIACENIFPELIESEDERIRKEIADFIYNLVFKPKDIKKKEKWLSWLEKQGEKESDVLK